MHALKRYTTTLFVLILFAMLVSACNIPNMALSQGNPGTGNPISLMLSSASGGPATPTPFMPLDPTPTYIPTTFPTLQPTPTPETETPDSDNYQASLLNQPENQINILLLGSDQRVGDGGFRTDTIILVSINTTAKTVSMVSFPRDLYLYIPGWTYQRINTAMITGGFDLLAATLQYNFGVRPDYYVLVNFSAFEEIVTSLGGIDVEVGRNFTDQYWDKTYKSFSAGTVHMDAPTALWYARTRTSSNDFDRARRQQEIVHAIAKRVLSIDIIKNAKDLYDIYITNVTTNLEWSEIAPLIPLTIHIKDTSQINRYVIGPGQVYDWITPGGAMVLLPRQDQIIAVIKDAIGTQ